MKNNLKEKSDIDYLYTAVMADTEALEDAKMTLEVIKKTEPDTFDEIINDSLALINHALSNPILGVVDQMHEKAEREWQGLTNEEINVICGSEKPSWERHIVELTETKLREKNNGKS